MNRSPSAKRRVVFLYNHDAAHQVAHISGIMAELALREPSIEVIAATGTAEIELQVRALITPSACRAVRWHDLSVAGPGKSLLSMANRVAPVERIGRLLANRRFFETADIVVSPERTCLRVRRWLRRKMGAAAPRFVFVPHGAGDRSVTYHPELAQFDYFLLSGQKVIDEMVAHRIATPQQCRLIGYPKFDVVGKRPPSPLFANDLPTVVYNPHFDPKLSSWYAHGPALLRAFAGMPDRYNLVFAPHVMLFRKNLHVSLEYRNARIRPEIPAEVLNAPNVLIDIASHKLFDMTYTTAADIYVGDVSSQIYEFLRTPRPSYFIDAAGQGVDAYQFWKNGPVVRSIDELLPLIGGWRETGARFREMQQKLFAYTIAVDPDRSAAERGAHALRELIDVSAETG